MWGPPSHMFGNTRIQIPILKLSVWTRINPYPENPQFSTQKLLNTKMAP